MLNRSNTIASKKVVSFIMCVVFLLFDIFLYCYRTRCVVKIKQFFNNFYTKNVFFKLSTFMYARLCIHNRFRTSITKTLLITCIWIYCFVYCIVHRHGMHSRIWVYVKRFIFHSLFTNTYRHAHVTIIHNRVGKWAGATGKANVYTIHAI